ncbi:MAG: hypothetical protein PHU43_00105 [Candidatus Bipolaricaulis sp.]|nr:hypothetical protein [Candidatus Bipolaricaulis sp.]
MDRRGLLVLLLLVLSAPLSCAMQLPSEAQPAACWSCDLGLLQATYPNGTAINTSFRCLLSLAVGEPFYAGYAPLLLADFEATISALPVFVDLDGDGLAKRLLLAAISLTATDIRWAHGGIRPATGEFLLYVHILVADLRAQGATVLGPQYVRLVLRGTLAQGATFLSIGGTGKVLGGSLAGTAITLHARCSPR